MKFVDEDEKIHKTAGRGEVKLHLSTEPPHNWTEEVWAGIQLSVMMLTQRVAAPLLQLSFTVQQYDEARIAVGLIAALVNQSPEEGRSRNGVRTPFVGRVEFSGVRFSQPNALLPASKHSINERLV